MIDEIIRIIKNAWKIHIDYMVKELNIRSKSESKFDVVTDSDLASSNYITDELKKNFPDDVVYSEENINPNIDYSKRVWIIDPLDGTYSYINQEDTFWVIIGCRENWEFILWAVYLPLRDELFYAQKWKGASYEKHWNLISLKPFSKQTISDCTLVYKKNSLEIKRLKHLFWSLWIKRKVDFTPIWYAWLKVVRGIGDILFLKKAGKRDIWWLECIYDELGYEIVDPYGNNFDYTIDEYWFVNGVIVVPKLLKGELFSNLPHTI